MHGKAGILSGTVLEPAQTSEDGYLAILRDYESEGYDTYLVGNISTPVLEYIEKDDDSYFKSIDNEDEFNKMYEYKIKRTMNYLGIKE